LVNSGASGFNVTRGRVNDKATVGKADQRHAMPQRDSPESDWHLVISDISTEGSKHRTCLSFPVV
jgi:hypothetical protein